MSSFTCNCGYVTHSKDEPAGTSLVTYTLPTLRDIERRIAERVSAFIALPSEAERLAWQRSFYQTDGISEHTQLEVIEDIVSFELNDGFMSMYRCPACRRMATWSADSNCWQFFLPDS